MNLKSAIFAVLLAAAPLAAIPTYADAIPMPETVTPDQDLLIGVWQEENPVQRYGLGHDFQYRTLAFANTDMTMLVFGGIAPSKMYSSSAMQGTWTSERKDDKTLVVTFTQTPERGTTLTLVFDGENSFQLSDAEATHLPASVFRRVTPGGR